MKAWYWTSLYYAVLPSMAMILPPLLLFPEKFRKNFLGKVSFLLKPLTVKMLFPGLLKGQTYRIERDLHRPDSDRLYFVFGGNNNTCLEAEDILSQIPFCDDSRLTDDSLPRVTFPLMLMTDQEAYREKILDLVSGYMKLFPNLKTVYLAGHSLGGAITLDIAQYLAQRYPHIKFQLSIDRTFSELWSVSEFTYGSIATSFMRKTFGLLWKFNSIRTIDDLKKCPNVSIFFYQVTPDEVLGPHALLCDALKKGSSLPISWKTEHQYVQDPEEELHAMPYRFLRKK